ncbi:very short patch repair endonuclease [Brachybacterium sp. GCM10030252]|uniref:very short patch repair endonuclease n=1 Tax=Brachybacterium sp. GCM10030252 TaxID=3273380 RepID=UPI0036165A32
MAGSPVHPRPTSEQARRTMLANRRRDTTIEIAVRRHLHKAGLRYRVDYAPDPAQRRRRADIVFPKLRIAVYIDGCFWHGCPTHYSPPKSNSEYWLPKIERNRTRDEETTDALRALGWTVLRYWEHEGAAVIAGDVAAEVRRQRK